MSRFCHLRKKEVYQRICDMGQKSYQTNQIHRKVLPTFFFFRKLSSLGAGVIKEKV